jgi:hypothetical protein
VRQRKPKGAVRCDPWRQKLPRPIVIKGGETLRLLSDCRSYAVDLDRDEEALPHWQQVARLMLGAANGGSLEDVVMQFRRILIHQNKLVLQG